MLIEASGLRYVALDDNDLLVHPDDKLSFHGLMQKNGFLNNPYKAVSRKNGYVFLYPMDDCDYFLKGKESINVSYQLNISALEKGFILPLDKKIQDSVWNNRCFNNEKLQYELCEYDALVYLIVRCIFDEHHFFEQRIKAIESKKTLLRNQEILSRLSLVVFKFAPRLIELIEQSKYDEIIGGYISYSRY